MLDVSSSASSRIVTSLKVAALVTVLGSLVLAAEQRLATQTSEISVAQTVATQTVPAIPASTADNVGQRATIDYFPARFPAPSGPAAEQPPTF